MGASAAQRRLAECDGDAAWVVEAADIDRVRVGVACFLGRHLHTIIFISHWGNLGTIKLDATYEAPGHQNISI